MIARTQEGVELALARLLSPGAGCAAVPISGHHPALWPGEAPALARAGDARRADFTAGRAAARLAMARIGRGPHALPRRPDGPPQWPAGITGSISHGAGWAVAAALPESLGLIGIDIESATAEVPEDEILTPAERAQLGEGAALPAFGAKEAAYKLQFMRTGRLIGFHELVLARVPGGFDARLADCPGQLPAILVRQAISPEHILSVAIFRS